MNKPNPLTGLVANYGDSDDEPDYSDAKYDKLGNMIAPPAFDMAHPVASIHPAPIPHCPWSACYDESSGFTYYWNQQTNAVTWEAPSEYLLALKLAQQQLHTTGNAEVSAEEWHLYQQALVERKPPQPQSPVKTISNKLKTNDKSPTKEKNKAKKRTLSSDEGKIELITSYHNSDSESNDESESPSKAKPPPEPLPPPAPPAAPVIKPKNPHKKRKTKPVEFGPSPPPTLGYTVPIGPELPSQEYAVPIGPELPPAVSDDDKPKTPERKENTAGPSKSEAKEAEKLTENEDEDTLFQKLKDKAKLLEKLGGELPSELQKIINEDEESIKSSPKSADKKLKRDLDIDDLLQEIEKKELPKAKSKSKDNESKTQRSNNSSVTNSPINSGYSTPPLEEIKALFPSSKAIAEEITSTILFPSATNIEQKETKLEVDAKEKKGTNLYLSNHTETSKKKLRISNSVLPDRKKTYFDAAAYTTKYSQHIEGFSTERLGLGFSKDDFSEDSAPKNTFTYGNGLTFTKGEVLNEEKKEEDLDDMADLVEAKLKYLNQLQPCVLTPVQEMLIQLQTLVAAYRAGALRGLYWRRWSAAAGRALAAHEAAAAPPGWTLAFLRSEGRYRYRREADGLEQWEYPAVSNTDMDISTTPPHPGVDAKQDSPPPLPPPLPAAAPPAPPPPPRAARVPTPPPPAWRDPPPPGIDDPPPPPPPPTAQVPPPPPVAETKMEIGDELQSFYNDIAELEKHTTPPAEHTSPEPQPPPPPVISEAKDKEKEKEREREKEKVKEKDREKNKEKEPKTKKKSKVKISSSIGMKHKSVSSMVAKWQQVASQIDSD